jgi:hypothetical protein
MQKQYRKVQTWLMELYLMLWFVTVFEEKICILHSLSACSHSIWYGDLFWYDYNTACMRFNIIRKYWNKLSICNLYHCTSSVQALGLCSPMYFLGVCADYVLKSILVSPWRWGERVYVQWPRWTSDYKKKTYSGLRKLRSLHSPDFLFFPKKKVT